MFIIGELNIPIDDIKKMTILEAGKDIKEALLHYYKNDTEIINIINERINDCKRFCILVTNTDELTYLLNFFSAMKLNADQKLIIRQYEISYKDMYKCINHYNQDDLLKKTLVKIEDDDWITLKDYKVFLEKFNTLTSSIPKHCSPLEIIKYAYDIVKSRPYNNVPNDESSKLSRKLSSAILGEYIVCAGYTKIFNAILREFGINCTEYHYKEYGNNGHCISLVNVNDPKYNINGLYYFDPTYDSYEENKENEIKYKYFLLSADKYDFENFATNSLFLKESKTTLKRNLLKCKLDAKNYTNELLDVEEENNNNTTSNNEENKYINSVRECLYEALDIDRELFEGHFSNLAYTLNPKIEEANLYEFYLSIRNEFKEEISRSDFIELLKNTGSDYKFAVKAFLYRYSNFTDEDIKNLEKIKRR